MEPMDTLDHYYAFLREHRVRITKELKDAYTAFREYPYSSTIWRTDFGGFVGVPLFFIGVLWVASTKTINNWIIVAIMVGFGFLLRYYQKHIINCVCRYFFDRGKRIEILTNYVEQCRDSAISQYPEEKLDELNQFYEYCRRSIISEDFRYYE